MAILIEFPSLGTIAGKAPSAGLPSFPIPGEQSLREEDITAKMEELSKAHTDSSREALEDQQ